MDGCWRSIGSSVWMEALDRGLRERRRGRIPGHGGELGVCRRLDEGTEPRRAPTNAGAGDRRPPADARPDLPTGAVLQMSSMPKSLRSRTWKARAVRTQVLR
jgi:hypothetical protein